MNEEQKWEMLKQALLAGNRGDELRPVVSKRTLFGIRSSVEERMDEIAAQIEEERRLKREADQESLE